MSPRREAATSVRPCRRTARWCTDRPAADIASQLTWFDRTGHVLGTLGDAAPYAGLALSPDERRVAVTLGTGTPENVDIWVIDIARNIRSRLTVDPGRDVSPVWSPDGTRIAFQSTRSRQPVAMRQTLSNETGTDELLLEGPGNFTMTPSGWSADGRFIAYTTRGSNVWVLPLFGDRKPFAFAETPFTEGSAVFSPDGRWIAYTSNEGGQLDVYVQPFPGPGTKSQVSRNGGSHPALASGRQGIVLSRSGWDHDGGPDRRGAFIRCRTAAGPLSRQAHRHSRRTRPTP